MDPIEKVKESSHEEESLYQFRPPAEELEMIFNSSYTEHGVERLRAAWEEIKRFVSLDISPESADHFLVLGSSMRAISWSHWTPAPSLRSNEPVSRTQGGRF